MKLTILQEKLKNGLNAVGRIFPKSLSLPILNNILFKAEKNFLQLTSTDLEIAINWWDLAKIEEEGKTTISTKLLTSFINLLPNQQIKIEKKDEKVFVKCENYATCIRGVSADDFPIVPQISDEKSILINNHVLCQSLSQVVDIAQPSGARPEISGIYFLFQKNLVKMVATDSFRLGEKTCLFEKPILGHSFILPQKTAREIINIFGERESREELKICFSPNQVLFEIPMTETSHPKIQLISRLIEGEYPNYEAIIPKKYQTQVFLPKDEFLNQIKTASLFSSKINEIKFKIDSKKEKIEIFSQNPEIGEYSSFLPGEIKGDNAEISFNYRFLLDGLLNIKSSDVIFELNGEEGPGVLKPSINQDYIYVVMPVKAS